MSEVKRLSRVAKECNVRIQTIVDFLHRKGISIENSPNAKIPPEALVLVMKEYQNDQADKREAVQFKEEHKVDPKIPYENSQESFVDKTLRDLTTQNTQLSNRWVEIEKELDTPYSTKLKVDKKYVVELDDEKKSLLIQKTNVEKKICSTDASSNAEIISSKEDLNAYQVIVLMLDILKIMAFRNPDIFVKTIQIIKASIEKLWENDYQHKEILFLDCLKNFLLIAEKHIKTNPEFFRQLTNQLNDRIEAGIRQDVERLKDNEDQFEFFRSDLKKVFERIEILNPQLPYIERYKNELSLISKKVNAILRNNALEKEKKIEILKQKYTEIIDERKSKVRWNFTFTYKSKYGGIILLFVIALAIVGALWKIIDMTHTPTAKIYVFLDAFIVVPICAIIGGIIGGVIGWVIKFIFDIIAESKAHNVALDNAINNVTLSGGEKMAYDSSMKEINNYFKGKDSWESLQESSRILLLNSKNFENEFSVSAIKTPKFITEKPRN